MNLVSTSIRLTIVKLFSTDNPNDNLSLCYILSLLTVKAVFKVLHAFLLTHRKVFNEH